MTPQDNLEAFLESFERAALAASLDQSRWAGQLGFLLIGRAQAAYWAMPWGEAVDYDTVKKEIMYRLDINPERYHQSFRMKKQTEYKTP